MKMAMVVNYEEEALGRRANQCYKGYGMCKIQRVAIILEWWSSNETYGCGIGHCTMEDASGASRSE